jgi:hypothetical protein
MSCRLSTQPEPGLSSSLGRSASLRTINEKQKLGADPKQVERISENQLTFNLLPLRLEGLASVLICLSQAENRGLLLLEGLAQVLV